MQDTPRNMRFSINFFTSIGLGGLTDDMREHLKVPLLPLPLLPYAIVTKAMQVWHHNVHALTAFPGWLRRICPS